MIIIVGKNMNNKELKLNIKRFINSLGKTPKEIHNNLRKQEKKLNLKRSLSPSIILGKVVRTKFFNDDDYGGDRVGIGCDSWYIGGYIDAGYLQGMKEYIRLENSVHLDEILKGYENGN